MNECMHICIYMYDKVGTSSFERVQFPLNRAIKFVFRCSKFPLQIQNHLIRLIN